jgi:hypothetical protein
MENRTKFRYFKIGYEIAQANGGIFLTDRELKVIFKDLLPKRKRKEWSEDIYKFLKPVPVMRWRPKDF